MPLNIQNTPTESSGTAKIAVEGRLDATTWKDLEDHLEPILSAPVETVILDLAKLSFISSAGIRVLITASNRLTEKKGKLLLTNMQPQIVKVLEIIKALPGVSLFRSVQELDDYLAAMQRKVIEEQ